MRVKFVSVLARSLAACVLLLLGSLAGASATGAAENKDAKHDGSAPTNNTFWIIPHTHWEGAVFKTREEYLDIGLPHILKALYLLQKYPDYRYVLDQAAYVRPFIERYPEEAATFRKFIKEGRLELVGAMDIMPDVNIPSGESIVRQILYGKGYYRDKLGVDVTVGWDLDTFGHNAQMPQLLKLAGYKSYWFQRGVHGNDTPSEFLWQGIDGTKIPAFWLPMSYGLFYPAPKSTFEFDRYARGIWESLGNYTHQPDRVAMAGADVADPEETLPELVHEFDHQANQPITLRFGLPTDFEAVADARKDRPVVTGELNPVFQGVYSSRIEVKQWMREDERVLTTAEKISAENSLLKAPASTEELMKAWEPVLFNQAHDLSSGTMVDKVYLDSIHSYEFSKTLGEEMIGAGLDALSSKIDTAGAHPDNVPVLVYNSLGWPRTDIAEVSVGFTEPGIASVRLLDSSGQAIPVQYTEAERYSDGGLKVAKLAFIAHEVPPLGYAIYQIVPEKIEPPGATIAEGALEASTRSRWSATSSSTEHVDIGSIENEYYRATFDLWTGAMTKLLVKSKNGDWEAIGNQPANVVAQEQDGGDFWELYGTLNGGRFTAMTQKQGLPITGRSKLSDEWVGGSGETNPGPVYSEFKISHPFGGGSFATTVRLYAGIRRIDFKTEILNNDKLVRYRALFPTSIKSGDRFDEIAFGSIKRPTAQEFPAQNWMDWSDGTKGLALLNRGIPGNNVADGTLMLSLMRSASISAYPFTGGYEPGVSSDLGLELGINRTFNYALLPHSGDWRVAEVYRAGLEFNNPLIVSKVAQHAGVLPKQWGLLEISQPSVAVTSLKPSRDGGVVLRVYEASGQQLPEVKIKMHAGVASAVEANLMEDPGQKLDVHDDTLKFALGPYEIKTLKLGLEPLGAKPAGGR
jgi:alpha-mannosidase